MICLTGDVHHKMGNPEQSFTDKSESKLAEKYTKISLKYDIKTTLFFTGKAFEGVKFESWMKSDMVEIGGHTWNAFRPAWIHRVFKDLTGSIYGPKFYQKKDIKKTLKVVKEYIGKIPSSWRTHSYASNKTTLEILQSVDKIQVISDIVKKDLFKPKRISEYNLISLPINVMPDHEHLYHGGRNKKHVQNKIENGWKDSFTSKSFYIEEYFEIIKSQIRRIEQNNGIATLLLHPICMKIADNFETFRKICKWISEKDYNTILCREAINYVDEK